MVGVMVIEYIDCWAVNSVKALRHENLTSSHTISNLYYIRLRENH